MRMYEGKVTFAVVGLGGRASAYLAALREFYPDGHAVVAVADPDPKKRLRAAQEYAVPESGLFETDGAAPLGGCSYRGNAGCVALSRNGGSFGKRL